MDDDISTSSNNTRMQLFFHAPHPLSQWTYSKFVCDGVDFCNAEQAMMFFKAKLFNDQHTQAKILRTKNPRDIKQLGRMVQNFNQAQWDAKKRHILYEINCAKFSQDKELAAYLCGTGDNILAEASPYDRVYGIGLSADHPDATNPSKWRGQNLLGDVLMDVRRWLRSLD